MKENNKQVILGLAMFGAAWLNFKSWTDPQIKFES